MKKRMYMIILAGVLALSIGACGSKTEKEESAPQETEAKAEETQEEEASEEEAAAQDVIKPLPTGIDVNNLKDCNVAVSFNANDINWRGGCVEAGVYSEILYDTVDVASLKEGSVILYMGEPVAVETIREDGSDKILNEGTEQEIMLRPYEGGTFVVGTYNDATVKEELGEVTLILSQNCVLHDCGENPGDEIEVSSDELKQYMEELEDWRKDFYPNNTTVLIEGDEVTEITRVWVP